MCGIVSRAYPDFRTTPQRNERDLANHQAEISRLSNRTPQNTTPRAHYLMLCPEKLTICVCVQSWNSINCTVVDAALSPWGFRLALSKGYYPTNLCLANSRPAQGGQRRYCGLFKALASRECDESAWNLMQHLGHARRHATRGEGQQRPSG